jgi:hypothetical protein
MRKEVCKHFIDLSKLIFGGVVLSSILQVEDVSKMYILILGALTALLAVTGGFYLIKSSKK